jgi:hypothetical protein
MSIATYSKIVVHKLLFFGSLSISNPNVVIPNEIRNITKTAFLFIILIFATG